MASLGEMAAGIAHEINNPLTGILSFASLVREEPSLDPELKPDLDIIIKETRRCARIVKGLLEFSRASVPQKKDVNLNKLIESVTYLLQQQSSFFNIQIINDLDEDIPDLLADPNQLSQVLMNIIINASHATQEGGSITVRTGYEVKGRCVVVEIADTGCGIPKENLGRIFDPFFTTKADGTGLGLAVSYGIIKNHGGDIDVKSEVGKGTTFTIKLPVQDAVEEERNEQQGSEK
jgi:two-component system NtrC family sensor kinase